MDTITKMIAWARFGVSTTEMVIGLALRWVAFYFMWNWLIPEMLGLPEITFLQAGLLALVF